jgi:hypothetical protein
MTGEFGPQAKATADAPCATTASTFWQRIRTPNKRLALSKGRDAAAAIIGAERARDSSRPTQELPSTAKRFSPTADPFDRRRNRSALLAIFLERATVTNQHNPSGY